MTRYLSHIIAGQHLIMSGERALFWESESTLIIADLHIGKTGHFRKEGIGVPAAIYKDDLHRLLSQILFFKAERLIIVGDLSHSVANRELDLFRKWRKDFPSLEVHLAKGNHDILDNRWYEEADIMVHNAPLPLYPFLFAHDIAQVTATAQDLYAFAGHIHPSVTIRGKGRQSLRLPCFYFTRTHCILPAFSRFTGSYQVRPEAGENVFGIVEKEVLPLQGKVVI
ncbi:MAG: ligase-associated DNA damage response endonuclease PdeM [Sphingobacteriales bacterium]|nr:ligase-associated DNA damage response endonuclease PdeM [Sphingobacteriales bacterium]OJW04755.1 MAG: metallophosphoesterase [Sphingobacteriales bacterium 44-61]